MKPSLSTPDYTAFLAEVKGRIQSARIAAGRAVNRELVLLYWDIGRGIVEKQKAVGWGESVVERLAADLRAEFPDMRSFSARTLRDTKRFYLAYSDETIWPQAVAKLRTSKVATESKEIWPQAAAKLRPDSGNEFLRQLVAEIPWGHHRLILDKLADPAARLYYLRATAQCGWSRSVLLNQIKAQAYERAAREKKTHPFGLALPEHFAEQADVMLKSRYNLEFLGIAPPMKRTG